MADNTPKPNKTWPQASILHSSDLSEALSYALFDIGATALEQKEEPDKTMILTRAGFPPGSDPDALAGRLASKIKDISTHFTSLPEPVVDWSFARIGDWSEKWKEGLDPVAIGDNLVVQPTWSNGPVPPGRKVVRLDPGMAFGTGRHATTFMCLELLEEFSRSTVRPPARILDVGTGSGILAMAAAVLWPARVLAVDNDPEAAAVAAENLSLNRLAGRVLLACAEPAAVRGPFDLILANLTAGALLDAAGEMDRLAGRNSGLILSGILTDQAPGVVDGYERLGFRLRERREMEEWTALCMEKPSVSSAE